MTIKLSQPQLQVLLLLRRQPNGLAMMQLRTKQTILKSLLDSQLIERDSQVYKITTSGIYAVSDHIKNNPVTLPETRTHYQEYEVMDLLSLYYPTVSIIQLMLTLKDAGFVPISCSGGRLYSKDKTRLMLEYLRDLKQE